MLKIKKIFFEIIPMLRINRFALINVQTSHNTEKIIANLLNVSDKNYRFFPEAGSFSSRCAVLVISSPSAGRFVVQVLF
jgi:hypothetical protein